MPRARAPLAEVCARDVRSACSGPRAVAVPHKPGASNYSMPLSCRASTRPAGATLRREDRAYCILYFRLLIGGCKPGLALPFVVGRLVILRGLRKFATDSATGDLSSPSAVLSESPIRKLDRSTTRWAQPIG